MDNLNKTIIGKDVIESLTLGMYEDARIIYREYLQNSADQIDKAIQQGILGSIAEGKIWIDIDKNTKQILIEDNATGISSKEAVSILKNIAQSTKQRGVDKGFRGIGRLGGLAYCDKLTFETSYKGESRKTIIEWDAKKLKFIINNRHIKEAASEVIDEITNTSEKEEKSESHYFKITLENVSSEILLNIADIRDYLSMVAPANFHPRFTFLPKIKNHINKLTDEYNIYVNSEEIYKSYTTKIYESSGVTLDEIKDIEFFEKYSEDSNLLLWGWYGIWSFSKQIPEKVNPARGLRLRKNNIQIGNEYCLVKLHRKQESRWNFYTFGEVYAVHPELIPNARRDYFLENSHLGEFEAYLQDRFKELYNLYHWSSDIRGAQRDILKLNEINEQIKEKELKGYKSNLEKDALVKKRQAQEEKTEKAKRDLLKHSELSKESEAKNRVFNELIKNQSIFTSEHMSSINTEAEAYDSNHKRDKAKIIFIDDNSLPRQSKEERKLIKRVFDIVDSCLPDKDMIENIRQKIIEDFNKGKQEDD